MISMISALRLIESTPKIKLYEHSFDDASTLHKSIKTYEPAFVARRNKVIKLVTGNPLSIREIAKILGFTISTITNDILALVNSCDIVNISKKGRIRLVVAA